MNHINNRIEDSTKPKRCIYCGCRENVRPEGPEGEPVCADCLFDRACKIAEECGL